MPSAFTEDTSPSNTPAGTLPGDPSDFGPKLDRSSVERCDLQRWADDGGVTVGAQAMPSQPTALEKGKAENDAPAAKNKEDDALVRQRE